MEIDHDPNEFSYLDLWVRIVVSMGVGVAFSLYRNPLTGMDWRDFTALTLFVFLLSWLLLPVRRKRTKHESAGQGIAFRLGKALNRVWRSLKS